MQNVPSDIFGIIKCHLEPYYIQMLSLSCKKFSYLKVKFNKMMIIKYCEKGNSTILELLHSMKFKFNEYMYAGIAASNGHKSIVKWLYSKGCPLDVYVSHRAAINGDLSMIEWLRDNHGMNGHVLFQLQIIIFSF